MAWFIRRRKRLGDIEDIFDYIDMQIWKAFETFKRRVGDIWSEEYPGFIAGYNIFEEEDKYVIELELPGVDKKDIDLEVKDEYLIISVKKKAKEEKKDKGYYVSKRFYSGFRKVIPLPPDVDVDKIKAKYENGILRIEIEKVPSGGRKISLD